MATELALSILREKGLKVAIYIYKAYNNWRYLILKLIVIVILIPNIAGLNKM